MRNLGGLLAFLGVFGMGLSFFGRVPSFLFWVYNWGDTVAWAIMIGLTVVGGLMYLLGSPDEADEEAG